MSTLPLRTQYNGKSCKQIIDDIQNKKIESYYWVLVPIELLGSIARIDPEKATIALDAFFSLPINMIQIDEGLFESAAILARQSGVSYDSIHAACMLTKSVNTIITENVTDWKKFKDFKIVRPLDYGKSART